MSRDTQVNLTPEVVDVINELQVQGFAQDWVEALQMCLNMVLRDFEYEPKERLKLAATLLHMQDQMREFIPKEGGAR